MTVANFIPEIWSARLLWEFEKAYKFRGLVNTDYEGEIKAAGDTVHINTPGAITVEDNTGDISYEAITSTQQDLVIDQQKRFAFQVNDVDQAQANINLVSSYTRRAAQSMADVVDVAIASEYTNAGNTVSWNAVTALDDAYKKITDISAHLSDANVPYAGRWGVVTPTVHKFLRQSPDFLRASDMGDNIMRSGQVGQIDGIAIFESNNVQIATTHKCMFGVNEAISFAMQFVTMEALRLELAFADGIRGLQVYGLKTVMPDYLVLFDVTVA